MYYRLAADLVVVVHLCFVCFVLAGGLLVLKWPRVAAIHVPAAVWGTLVEMRGWICPLTPLEQYLRRAGGQAGYTGDFIDHYLVPVLYPADLTRDMQLGLGALVVLVNMLLYVWVITRVRRGKRGSNRQQAG